MIEGWDETELLVAGAAGLLLLVMLMLPKGRKLAPVPAVAPAAVPQLAPLTSWTPPAPASEAPKRLQTSVKKVLKHSDRMGDLVSDMLAAPPSEHAMVAAAKRTELEALEARAAAVAEETAQRVAAVPAARAEQRAKVLKELSTTGDFTGTAVIELHALGGVSPEELAGAEMDHREDEVLTAVLEHVRTQRDVPLVCADEEVVLFHRAVLRASGVLRLVPPSGGKVPETGAAFRRLAAVLHGDTDVNTIADLAQVLPLLAKYACSQTAESVRATLARAVETSPAAALQVYCAVCRESSELEQLARAAVLQLFPFEDVPDAVVGALPWPALQSVLLALPGPLSEVEDLHFLQRWRRLAGDVPGVNVQPYVAPQSAAELELLHGLMPTAEYVTLAQALGASHTPEAATVEETELSRAERTLSDISEVDIRIEEGPSGTEENTGSEERSEEHTASEERSEDEVSSELGAPCPEPERDARRDLNQFHAFFNTPCTARDKDPAPEPAEPKPLVRTSPPKGPGKSLLGGVKLPSMDCDSEEEDRDQGMEEERAELLHTPRGRHLVVLVEKDEVDLPKGKEGDRDQKPPASPPRPSFGLGASGRAAAGVLSPTEKRKLRQTESESSEDESPDPKRSRSASAEPETLESLFAAKHEKPASLRPQASLFSLGSATSSPEKSTKSPAASPKRLSKSLFAR